MKTADTQVAGQAKIALAGHDARTKLAQLDQLSGKFGNNFGTKINARLNEWGLPTQSGTDQDAFKSNLGDSSMNQAGRVAAINRYRTVLQRDVQIGWGTCSRSRVDRCDLVRWQA